MSRSTERLPLQPLLDAAGFDAYHVVDVGGHRGHRATRPVTAERQLADRLGVTRRTVHRWRRDGLPVKAADEAAVRGLGIHPWDVWGDEWLQGVPA